MQEQQRKLSAQKDVQALKEKYQLLVKECDVKKKTFENIKDISMRMFQKRKMF